MTRLVATTALAALVGCTNSGLQTDMLQQPLFANPADAIDGEFVIGADVPEDLATELGILRLDYDDALGTGLYSSEGDDGVDLWTLSTALRQNLRGDLVVEHNRVRTASATTVNDPNRRLQWNLDMLHMNDVWDLSTGAGVTVAVIDTGVSTRGRDVPVNYLGGRDFISNDNDPTDGNGHGTHVAGTIAQATNNGRGEAGVAFDANVMGVRVLDSNGSGTSYTVAQGIQWAADNGADVLSLSLGSPSATSVERDAVNRAIQRGAIVVAASGNEYRNSLSYPAAYSGVIAVGAVGADGRVSPYSNGGQGLDVVAPGGNMSMDYNRDGYADGILQETLGGDQWFEGTSMATPHVSAVVALLLSAGAAPADIPNLLTSTASNGGQWDIRSGYGIVDPLAALQAIGAAPGNPGGGNPPPPPPPGGGGGGGTGTDTRAPRVSSISGWRSWNELTLSWHTNEPATTAVSFEGFGVYDDGGGLVTDHEMVFYVDPNATYYFRVVSADAAGNERVSGRWVTTP